VVGGEVREAGWKGFEGLGVEVDGLEGCLFHFFLFQLRCFFLLFLLFLLLLLLLLPSLSHPLSPSSDLLTKKIAHSTYTITSIHHHHRPSLLRKRKRET